MSLNGKRDKFELSDLIAFGNFCGIKARKANRNHRASIMRKMGVKSLPELTRLVMSIDADGSA